MLLKPNKKNKAVTFKLFNSTPSLNYYHQFAPRNIHNLNLKDSPEVILTPDEIVSEQTQNLKSENTNVYSTNNGPVVKIECQSLGKNPLRFWSKDRKVESSSSGTIIEVNGKVYIITNSHCVSDCYVNSAGSEEVKIVLSGFYSEFKAKVVAISHERDIALLLPDPENLNLDERLRQCNPIPINLNFLELTESMPKDESPIEVIGFPLNGKNLNTSKGIINRRVSVYYAHVQTMGFAYQVSAVIAPGSSGGPVFYDKTFVGVIFETRSDVPNMNYVIPASLISVFLNSILGVKVPDPNLTTKTVSQYFIPGFEIQIIINKDLRDSLGLNDTNSIHDNQPLGVRIKRVQSYAHESNSLEDGDILINLCGLPVFSDGTVPFYGSRVSCDVLNMFTNKIYRKMNITVLRKENDQMRTHNIEYVCHSNYELVPRHIFDKTQSYCVFGGLVLQSLSLPLIGAIAQNNGGLPINSLKIMKDGLKEYEDQETVVLSEILMSDCDQGYNVDSRVVVEVNGVPVRNVFHLYCLANDPKRSNGFTEFKFADNKIFVINNKKHRAEINRILEDNGFPRDGFRFAQTASYHCDNTSCSNNHRSFDFKDDLKQAELRCSTCSKVLATVDPVMEDSVIVTCRLKSSSTNQEENGMSSLPIEFLKFRIRETQRPQELQFGNVGANTANIIKEVAYY